MYNLDQTPAQKEDATYDLTTVLKYLITQMTGSTLNTPTSTVQSATVTAGAQTSVNTPQGTPIIVMSVLNGQGLTKQLIFPETLTFTCTKDSQNGATAGRENVLVTGLAAVQDVWSPLYPGGSGCAVTLTAVDGTSNNVSGGNILQNSDFQTYTTANNPDNWTIATGAAGTDVINSGSGNAYTTGGGSVEFAGDGSTLVSLTQSFNVTPVTTVGAGGTSYALKPNTQYAFNVWIKTNAVPAAGVIHFDLIDGAGNVLNDDFGTANTIAADLTSGGLNVGSTYVNVNGTFRTPKNLLTQTTPFKLRIISSTALTSGKNAYFGRMAMAEMTELYTGGPSAVIFSSKTKMVNGLVPDTWTVAMANNYTSSTHGLFHLMCDKVFELRKKGLQMPYAASPTIADTLIS